MIHLTSLIPQSAEGASRFGVHFLKDWQECPFRAALKYLAPAADDGWGLMPRTKARPLTRGDAFHVGIEEWYASRVTPTGEDTGAADIDRAVAGLEARMARLEKDYEDPLEMAADRDAVRDLLYRYNEKYGPGGETPEWPEYQVYVDESGPWIEREITVDLDWHGFVLTNRMDLLMLKQGRPLIMEHKTSSGSFIQALCNNMENGWQAKAELFALQSQKDINLNVSSVVVNVINNKPPTRRGPRTIFFKRHPIYHSPMTLKKFHMDVLHTLEWIEDMLGRYNHLLEGGVDHWEAILRIFPKHGGLSQQCYSYGRHCDYWNLCQATGREVHHAPDFNPRVRKQDETE